MSLVITCPQCGKQDEPCDCEGCRQAEAKLTSDKYTVCPFCDAYMDKAGKLLSEDQIIDLPADVLQYLEWKIDMFQKMREAGILR